MINRLIGQFSLSVILVLATLPGLAVVHVVQAQEPSMPLDVLEEDKTAITVLSRADEVYLTALLEKLDTLALEYNWTQEEYKSMYYTLFEQIAGSGDGSDEFDPRYSPATGKEDFEGTFPDQYWFVGDGNTTNGSDYWNDVSCRSYAGSWSAWCSGTGGQPSCVAYDNFMDAYMYVEAQYLGLTYNNTNRLVFELWSRVEDCCDYFQLRVEGFESVPPHGAGTPNALYTSTVYDTGAIFPWDTQTISLPASFDPCLYVRVKFIFHSDFGVGDEGAYLDEIEFNSRPDTLIYPISGGFCTTPNAPSGVDASDGFFCDKVRVTWNNVAGATSYKVYRSTSNSACPGSPIANSVTGTSYDDTSASSGTTYYYSVKASNACGDSSCSSTNSGYRATSSSTPSGASASPSSICPGSSSSTLTVQGGSLGSGASWQWYRNSCGGTWVGSGSSISVSPSSTTTYYVRAEGTCYTTDCASVTVTVNSQSTAPSGATASPSSVCSGGSSTLSVQGGSLGSGATWRWYSGSCGGVSVGSGASINVRPGSTTTYYVRAEGGTCPFTTNCANVTVTVNSQSSDPSAVSANPSLLCAGGSSVLTVQGGSLGSGANWQWYSGWCGGTWEGSGPSITVWPGSTTTYYVRAEGGTCNVTTNCASATVSVQDSIAWYPDSDGDGYGAAGATPEYGCAQPPGKVANADDCDDNCSLCRPGGTEVCDGKDNDCDGQTDEGGVCDTTSVWYRDSDGDGYGDPFQSTQAIQQPPGFVNNDLDCNDSDVNVNPSTSEVCNGIDDNCNGTIDEGTCVDPTIWYRDVDADGFGNTNVTTMALSQPPGYVARGGDCNDSDPEVNPAASELCYNGIDDNCDELIDASCNLYIWYQDSDSDGYGNANVTRVAPQQPAGFVDRFGDCNDQNPAVNPGAAEVCDEIDNDCDGQVNEGGVCVRPPEPPTSTWYQDADGDGYGNPSASFQAVNAPPGYVDNDDDCDDSTPLVSPAGPEVCGNGMDDDCDGQVDEIACVPVDPPCDPVCGCDGICGLSGASMMPFTLFALLAAKGRRRFGRRV